MLYYKSINSISKIDFKNSSKNEIKEIKIPYWQNLFLTNLNNNPFHFLLNNVLFNSKVTSSLIINSKNTNVNSYHHLDDSKKMFPIKFYSNDSDASFLTDYLYIRNSSFIKFFINNMIDVPVCFKKSSSLKTRNFELPLLKFSNFLMKQGKKEKIIKLIFTTFRIFFKNIKSNTNTSNTSLISWFNLYFFGSNLINFFNNNDKQFISFKFENLLNLNYSSIVLNDDKIINSSFFFKNYLYFLLSRVSPIFSYFIYSVDKNIRKYSRGKSGKYTFIWKFVAPYKRIHLAVRWLIKDIKFNQNRSFHDRLFKTFNNIVISPEKSFSWKSKIFSHNYVFKNFRKSLMSSLRTTS